LVIRLIFHKTKMVENKHFWLKFINKLVLENNIFLLIITDFALCFIMCVRTTHFITFHIYRNYRNII